MDPLTAFSLAANVLQFVEFAGKIVHKSYDIYKSGTLSDHVSIEAATLRLASLSESIKSSNESNLYPSSHSAATSALRTVATECLNIAKDIEDALLNFKPKNNGKLESVRVAIRAVFKQKKLEELEEKLSRCRQEMLVNFVAVIQSDLDSVNERLTVLGEENKTGHGKTQEDLRAAVEKILSAIEARKFGKESEVDLDEVTRQLRQIDIATAVEQQFLNDLYLPILELRERQVVDAAENTFYWIFNELNETTTDGDMDKHGADGRTVDSNASSRSASSDNKYDAPEDYNEDKNNASKHESTGFEDWLAGGKEIFWITGKPGSGKSTLMKYISTHPRTYNALQSWAGQSELVVATAYFWISGDPRQRSLTGLWRSLCYNILSKHPSLIRSLFPWRWRRYETTGHCSEEMSEDELFQAIERLPSMIDQSYRFCFFIDGLDEFQGDHKKLAQTVRELAKSDSLKICVSSRPWEAFRSSFVSHPTIQVHNWTEVDIKRFAKQQLMEHSAWSDLIEDSPEDAETLVVEISSRAFGVFLWVYLVVRELKAAIDDGDTISELLDRLKIIPTDLNKFIKRMLDNIPPQYQDETKRYITVSLICWQYCTPLWMIGYTTERTPNFGELAAINPSSLSAALSRFENLKRRYESRCRDLFHVIGVDNNQYYKSLSPSSRLSWWWERAAVTSIHRSVNDYLLSDGSGYIHEFLKAERLCYNIVKRPWATYLQISSGLGSDWWRLQSALAETKRIPSQEIEVEDLLLVKKEILIQSLGEEEPPINYLDEVKMVTELMVGDEKIVWPSMMFPRDPYCSFLDAAVAYGWSAYVERKLMLLNDGIGLDQEAFERLFSFIGLGIWDKSKNQLMKETSVIEWVSTPLQEMAMTLQKCSQSLYERRGDAYHWIIQRGCDANVNYNYWAKFVRQYRNGEQQVCVTYRWLPREVSRRNSPNDSWDGWQRYKARWKEEYVL